MRYSVYVRAGQFLSLMDEGEAVWQHLTAHQRDLLLHALQSDVKYQHAVAHYPPTTVIEIPLNVLPWEVAHP